MQWEIWEAESFFLGRTVRCGVLLPKQPSGKWLLLHGYGGDENQWRNQSPIAAAQRFGLTVVMPGCGDGYYEDTQEPMGVFLGEELPGLVRRRYSLSPHRKDTFIGGVSMGGFGAVLLGSRYSRVFGKILSFGGAFIIGDVVIGNPGVLGRNADVDYFRRIFGDFETLEDSSRDPLWEAKQAVSERRMGRVF